MGVYPLKELCPKRGHPVAHEWLENVYKEPLLHAFSLLRNSDIHEESFLSNYRVTIEPRPEYRVTREFILAEERLLALRKFRGKSNLARVLTTKPIPTLAESLLTRLDQVVSEAISNRCIQ